jgi:4-amino-4-deoxy-L-arabinose transferase-like glycosyltransferase
MNFRDKFRRLFTAPKLIIIALFLVLLAIYFSFGFHHISQFITADEHLWVHVRFSQYWEAIVKHQWKKTYINDKPGITLAYISGIPGLIQQQDFWKHELVSNKKYVEVYHPEQTGDFYQSFRFPIVIFNGLFSIFFFWVIKKITDDSWIALWSAILILLSPVLLGMSQIVNPDALLWTFGSATLFSFLAFLKTEEKKAVFLTAFFLGLSLLTKYTAVILYPFLFLVTVLHYFNRLNNWEEKAVIISKKIFSISVSYLAIVAGSVFVYAIFTPAVFFNRALLFKGTIGYSGMKFAFWPLLFLQMLIIMDSLFWKGKTLVIVVGKIGNFWKKYYRIIYVFLFLAFIFVLANWMSDQSLMNFDKIPFGKKHDSMFAADKLNIYQKIVMEFYPLVFSLTPLTILSLLYIWFKSTFRKTAHDFIVLVVSLFVLVYFTALIEKNLISTIRYSIMLYPLLSVLAAIGIYTFFSEGKFKPVSRILITIGLIIASSISLWLIKPFYLNYANDLLPNKFTITNAWGFGGYEAARYLNAMPNAKNLVVWSDYYGFCDFFIGNCQTKYVTEEDKKDTKIDYLVLTKKGRIRFEASHSYKESLKKEVPGLVEAEKYYRMDNPDWQLLIDNRTSNYVKIFKTQD